MQHNRRLLLALTLSFVVPSVGPCFARATHPQGSATGPHDEEIVREIIDLERQEKEAALCPPNRERPVHRSVDGMDGGILCHGVFTLRETTRSGN